MALDFTPSAFKLRNEFFSERSDDAITAAIQGGRVGISLAICVEQMGEEGMGQDLYDQLLEWRTIELLLSGFTGLPTSVTKESGMLADVRLRLRSLYALATPRCGVLNGHL
jgi:hypothetical protein